MARMLCIHFTAYNWNLVPIKLLIIRVKKLIDFFMRPKQSERLEDIQKKYPDTNKNNDDESLESNEPKKIIVSFNKIENF